MLFKEVLTFGSVEEMLCSDHLKQPFVHLFFPCGLIVYYAVRADSEFFTCLSRKKPREYEKHDRAKSQAIMKSEKHYCVVVAICFTV